MTARPHHLEEGVLLSELTTMRIGGPAQYLVRADDVASVRTACDYAESKGLEVLVLGEGSNMIVSDAPLGRLVLRVEIPGFEIIHEDARSATIEIGGGEHWDGVVERSVELGLAGIEAMSMIPGTTGAAPVQNAGAYGQEISGTLVSLEAYDRREHQMVKLLRQECDFSYRMSAFKGKLAGRYVICSVTLKLSKLPPAEPTYASLRRYLDAHELANPSLAQIRAAVMAVRATILPDPSIVPNTGSFFKNPIVEKHVVDRLRRHFPDMPVYDHGQNYKLAAGWMLDQCGLKGTEKFGLVMHTKHALVITNPHHVGFAELEQLVKWTQAKVYDKFAVRLEPEPQFIL